jgi:hypothetical protein
MDDLSLILAGVLGVICFIMCVAVLFEGSKPKGLKVGDKMPKDAKGPFGAMIKVCPCCDRIDVIFHP